MTPFVAAFFATFVEVFLAVFFVGVFSTAAFLAGAFFTAFLAAVFLAGAFFAAFLTAFLAEIFFFAMMGSWEMRSGRHTSPIIVQQDVPAGRCFFVTKTFWSRIFQRLQSVVRTRTFNFR